MAQEIPEMADGSRPIDYLPGDEYGAQVIHSVETGTPRLFHRLVLNDGLIENLP